MCERITLLVYSIQQKKLFPSLFEYESMNEMFVCLFDRLNKLYIRIYSTIHIIVRVFAKYIESKR